MKTEATTCYTSTIQDPWDQWYASPQGAYALCREKALLQRVLSSWPRRGHSLLNIQCGTGIFLDFFWEGGFDITGVDKQDAFVAQAQNRLDGKAEIFVAAPDYLPFDDNEFDYVALLHGFDTAENAKATLTEALRVAAKGVVLTFYNPWSVAHAARSCCRLWGRSSLGRKLGSTQDLAAPWSMTAPLSPLTYYKMLRKLSNCAHMSLRTTLIGPQWTWGKYSALLNCFVTPLPMGAMSALRVDHHPVQAGTPLPLRLQNVRFKNLTPVRIMERRRKDAS